MYFLRGKTFSAAIRMMTRVKQLFRGHPALLLGLNLFLPEEDKSVLTDDAWINAIESLDCEGSTHFVTEVMERLQSKPDVYKSFAEIIKNFMLNKMHISEVRQEVALLFENHPDLLASLRNLIPDLG